MQNVSQTPIMSQPLRQLVLIPAAAQWQAASQAEFVLQLQGLGLLGQGLAQQSACFMTGQNFLQQFSFMGCAPSLSFAPADAMVWQPDEFVYVHVHAAQGKPLWFADALLGKPACPHCGRRNPGWHAHLDAQHQTITCVHCQQAAAACEWQWYDAGGCARQFISIVNVYPKESVPTDAVLAELAGLTGVDWRYFYLHASLPGAA